MGKILAGTMFGFAIVLLALSGCAQQAASTPEANVVAVSTTSASTPVDTAPVVAKVPAANDAALRDASKPGVVDYSCETDTDCAIKDVGNCCGTYPACVNSDSPTFPDQVKAQCAENGMSSVCGFPVLSGCQCVDKRCEGTAGVSGAPGGRVD